MKLFRILFATLLWIPILWTGNQALAQAETTSSDIAQIQTFEGSQISPAQDFHFIGLPEGFEEYDFSEDIEPDDAPDSQEDGISAFANALCLCADAYRLSEQKGFRVLTASPHTPYYIAYRKLII